MKITTVWPGGIIEIPDPNPGGAAFNITTTGKTSDCLETRKQPAWLVGYLSRIKPRPEDIAWEGE